MESMLLFLLAGLAMVLFGGNHGGQCNLFGKDSRHPSYWDAHRHQYYIYEQEEPPRPRKYKHLERWLMVLLVIGVTLVLWWRTGGRFPGFDPSYWLRRTLCELPLRPEDYRGDWVLRE